MNILMIGTIDSRGGAGVISYNLKQSLAKQGHNTNMFVRWKYANDPKVKVIPKNFGQDFLINFFANDLSFSNSDWILKQPEFKNTDIIHCHNLHSNFFNLSTLVKIARIKPVVWTQHDLWAMTGGCTDSYRCQHSPQKRMFFHLWDNAPRLLKQKKHLYAKCNFHLVTPSQWIFNQYKQSVLKDKPMSLIYNGVDTQIYKPQDKYKLRCKLELPIDKKIILCNSVGGIANTYKGGNYIKQIITNYKTDKKVIFVSIGGSDNNSQFENLNIIPYCNNPKVLADYYSASDLFLYPTLADNCPLVLIESLACGTPAVAFTVGGVPEIVTHQKQGYLAKYMNIDDLQKGIDWLLKLNDKEIAKISDSCVQKVNQQFGLEKMTDQYLDLYQKVINDF